MHEQIFIAALVVHILVLARPWRELVSCELPVYRTPPAIFTHSGLYPVVRKKGRSKYPTGFA
jgi:hypothetical protein